MIPDGLPLWGHIAGFLAAAAVIGVSSTRMARLADRLADRTGMGEALTGGLFLGVTTSLPGITTSVTAALQGFPAMAVSNALGGIAVQTAFLAVADMFHRKANLEHAAASAVTLLQTSILITMLALPVLSMAGPPASFFHVHPVTLLLFAAYGGGLWLLLKSTSEPMWQPRHTPETVADEPETIRGESLIGLWIGFAVAAILVIVAGVVLVDFAGAIVEGTGMSESLMGGLFTAIVTSLAELFTTVAAVRRGALTLAVSDIVGGNSFDVLFICVADLAYLKGSIYHAAGSREIFLGGLAILLNSILLMGLIHREKRGIGNIGFESILILAIYLAGFLTLWFMP